MNKRELVSLLVGDLDPRNEFHRNLNAVFRQVDRDIKKFLEMMYEPQQFAGLLRTEAGEVTINKMEIGINVTTEPGKTQVGKVLVDTTFAFNGCLTISVEPVGQAARPRADVRCFSDQPIATGKVDPEQPTFTPVNDEPQFSLTRPIGIGRAASEVILNEFFRTIDGYNRFKAEEFKPSIGFTDNGFYIVLS